VIPGRDPAAMTPKDRLAELALILARGFSRSCARERTGAAIAPGANSDVHVKFTSAESARNQLAASRDSEPSCVDAVNAARNEVA